MTASRRFILAVLLITAQLFGQVVLAGHSIEHAVHEKQLPTHSCAVCIAGHSLGTAATQASTGVAVVSANYDLPPEPTLPQSEVRPLSANQRAPPTVS